VAVAVAPAAGEPRGLGAEAATTRLEEDYQVRLALAISASDHAGLVDADSVQIRAAELISLGGAAGHDRSPAEALSARYWNHSVVNYDEHLPDGFYDVCGAQLHPGFQANFPSLGYLRRSDATGLAHGAGGGGAARPVRCAGGGGGARCRHRRSDATGAGRPARTGLAPKELSGRV